MALSLVSVLLVNVLAIAPLVVAESGELLILATYPDSDNFSSIKLSCVYNMSGALQSEGIGAIFQLNGTDIREEINEVDGINGTVHFLLTQKKEGFFNCFVNGSSSNLIGLAAQPSTNYSGQSVIHEVELPDDDSSVSTELQCDIQPGALRQRYSVQWVQEFNSFDIIIADSEDMFNLTLTVNSSTNGSLYQCSVTINHNGSGLKSIYKGRLIEVITTEAIQQGSSNDVIVAILSIFVPIILILLITCPILCCFFCIEARIHRRHVRRHSFKRHSLRRHPFRRHSLRRHSLRSSESNREVDVSSFDYQRMRDQGEADYSSHNAPEHQENQDSDQDHHCPTPSQEHIIHENLSLTSDPIPGVSLDQDRPEQFTEMYKITENEYIPQGEDFLTYSCETQILLPTSGPQIDSHNTREYIPACFTPVATLSQCTHDGRWYYDEHNDFGLEIPAGAIPKKESITIDIGVALYGPFQCPEGLRPVSPVFWVCVRDQKDFQFSEPVKVTIPHCLNLKLCDDIESLGLTFLKGDHEMNSNPQQMYQFRQAEGDVIIEPLKIHAVIKITHFCSLCFSCKDRRDLFEKEIFCLYSVIPCNISPDHPSDAYFFITLRLKTCLTTVQKQIKKLNLENHKEEKEKFQFSNVQELEMFLPQSSPAEWRVGMRGKKKILMRDVDFFVKEFCETTKEELEVDEEEGMYPPRFHVVLSCSSSARESQTRIEFRGTTTDLVFDIFLTPAVASIRSPKPQVPDISSTGTRPAAPRTRGVSTSSSSSDKDGHALLASIGSGCSSIHEQVGPTPLGIDDLFDITTELCDVAKRWRYIGLALRLRNPDLNRIATEGRPVTDCLTDMLELWLNKSYDVIKYGEPSWEMLENAVRARAGGNNPALADQIHRKYIT